MANPEKPEPLTESVASDAMEMRLINIVLAVIIVIAAALRFVFLDTNSLWSDELFSFNSAHPDLSFLQSVQRSVADPSNPPLYNLFLYGYLKTIGFTAWTGRSFSALTGVLGLVVIYFLALRLWGQFPAFVTTAILSLHNLHFFYSQEARSYSLLFLLLSLFIFCLVKLKEQPGIGASVLLAGLIVMCAYTHYLAIPVMGITCAIFLFLIRHERSFRYFIFYVIPLATFLCIPLLFLIVSDAASSGQFWTENLTLFRVLQVSANITGGTISFGLFLLLLFFVPLTPLRTDRVLCMLTVSVILYSGIVLCYSLTVNSIFVPRYFLPLLPLVVLVMGRVVSSLKTNRILVVAFVLSFSWPTFLAATNAFDRRGHGHNPRDMLLWLADNQEQYPILSSPFLPTLLDVYKLRFNRMISGVDLRILSANDRFWLLQFHTVQDPISQLDESNLLPADLSPFVMEQKVQSREAVYLIELR